MVDPVTLEALQGELERFAKGALRDELSEMFRRLDSQQSSATMRLTQWARAGDAHHPSHEGQPEQVMSSRSSQHVVRPWASLIGMKRYGNEATRQELQRFSGLHAATTGGRSSRMREPEGPGHSDSQLSAASGDKSQILLHSEFSTSSCNPLLDHAASEPAPNARRFQMSDINEDFEVAVAKFSAGRAKGRASVADSVPVEPDDDSESVSLLEAAEEEGARSPSVAQDSPRSAVDSIGGNEMTRSRSVAQSVFNRRRGTTAANFDAHGQEWRLTWFVRSPYFEQLTGMLVVLNSLVLGWEAHYEAMHPDSKLPVTAHYAETAFCVIFVVELLLRMHVGNFLSEGCGWNVFDSLMVLFMVVDQMAQIFKELQLPVNLSVVRVLRLLRLIRITRLIRVLHLFDELRTIVTSMSRSGGSLGWALLMVLMMIYVFSVLFLQVIADSGKLPDHPSLHHWFGGLWRTALTMFECIVGGVSWDEVIVPLMEDVSPIMGLLLCIYVTVAVFAMLNLVTGVFVENVAKTVREDKDILLALRITELFLDGDEDSGQEITWEAFAEKMQSSVMQELFKAMDVNPSEARHLFDLLDADGSGSVDADEIVNGCLTLRGAAKSLDISILLRAVAAVQDSVDWQFNSLRDSLVCDHGHKASAAPPARIASDGSFRDRIGRYSEL